ncbi:MAG: hypothetical protein ABJB10_12890 [Mesorhizobium sp.]
MSGQGGNEGRAMARWGRNEAEPGAVAPSRLGKRSVILPVIVFAGYAVGIIAYAIITWVAGPSDAFEFAQNIVMDYLMALFLVVAPVMHIAGVVCGAMALARSNDNRWLGLLGITINGLSVAAGLGVFWAAVKAGSAWT